MGDDMSIRKVSTLWGLVLVGAVLQWSEPCFAQTPDLSLPNFTNSPLLRKFVDSLPGLGAANANNLGQYIPVAIPDNTGLYPGDDYYEIELREYTQQMHSDLPATKFRGYRQTNMGGSGFHYLGPLIIAQRDKPVRIKFTNSLPTGTSGNLFIPVDTTANGAGVIPQGITAFTITDGGSGYLSPTVAITGGGGSGARATATINDALGTVSSIAVTSGGVGYSVPSVTFTGGGPTVPATATVTVVAGAISAMTITYGGIGYTSAPLVTIMGGGGTGATAHATISAGGVVNHLTIDNPGSN